MNSNLTNIRATASAVIATLDKEFTRFHACTSYDVPKGAADAEEKDAPVRARFKVPCEEATAPPPKRAKQTPAAENAGGVERESRANAVVDSSDEEPSSPVTGHIDSSDEEEAQAARKPRAGAKALPKAKALPIAAPKGAPRRYVDSSDEEQAHRASSKAKAAQRRQSKKVMAHP